MEKSAKIFVAGHKGLVGSALVRRLTKQGYQQLILQEKQALDLTQQQSVFDFFKSAQPDYILLAAAKVGGIHANNTLRGEFIYQNLMIETNIIEAARRFNTKRLLFLGSSCIYPRDCPQPIKEEYLLSGYLESTNEPYAIAKIAGIKLCEAYNSQYGTDFVSVMPTNLYGPQDNFDLTTSHVLPALLRKFHEAKISNTKQVSVWGSGSPRREFLHVDDLADACIFVMNQPNFKQMVNIGSGEEVTIKQLAELIAEIVQYQGQITFDSSKPDGTPRKLLDTSRLNALGWKAGISLQNGIRSTYEWFLKNH